MGGRMRNANNNKIPEEGTNKGETQLLLMLIVLHTKCGQQAFQQQDMANHVAIEGGKEDSTL